LVQTPNVIVLISTGTGIGPIFGFAQQFLNSNRTQIPLTLHAGYRDLADICLLPELEALSATHSNFSFTTSLTNPPANWTGQIGRVTETVPPLLTEVEKTHFHLVGNRAMIEDFTTAFDQLGIEGYSTEGYFNWDADPNPTAVAKIVTTLAPNLAT